MKSVYAVSGSSPAPRAITPVVVAMLIFLVPVLVTACGGTSDTTASTTSAGTRSTEAQVIMKDIAFDPASVTINAGETVTWTNEDSATHTVVGDNGEFESGDLTNGDTFSFTVDQADTYSYHCSIHPSMTGEVVVQ